ncbi:MAG: GNAT family N-acetyltransferase [Deltaproteobacteria bacterium]|nr:GNAT family N-acetyltransferase [Deltaproteobacteria bacterium]
MSDLRISTRTEEVDFSVVFRFLSHESYWAKGISEARLRRAIANSICVSAFRGDAQVGFARVVTDRATFAYLCDVFVDERERGAGVGKALVAAAIAHPDLTALRRWLLATRGAHGLYAKFGFTQLLRPDVFMELFVDEPYRKFLFGESAEPVP